jgi:hypothetical protein
MLKNIVLIASIISALTAVTTSLRALGKSRENSRIELEARMKSGCRVGNYKGMGIKTKINSLLIHSISTFIWLTLSIIFFFPTLIHKWSHREYIWIIGSFMVFIAVITLILIIWWKALHKKN